MAEIFQSDVIELGSNETLAIQHPTEPTVVLSLILSNNHYGTVPVSVWLKRGDQLVYLRRGFRIDAGDSLDVLRGTKVALLPGDVLMASVNGEGAVSGILSTFKDE